MSRKTFQQYGRLADSELSHTVKSGRYRIQADKEPYLIKDIINKLELDPSDRLLEIGCGTGNLLIPLSFMVSKGTGIDHPDVVAGLSKRFNDPKLRLIGIDFLDYCPERIENYEKILINSVLPALSDKLEAFRFIDKAASLLAPGGRMLLGDIANLDKKRRFTDTNFGKNFDEEWNDRVASLDGRVEEDKASQILDQDDTILVPNDEFILELLARFRRPGWEAYCLPQHVNLPFGHTREDVLVTRLPE